jgi:hypothetical protein
VLVLIADKKHLHSLVKGVFIILTFALFFPSVFALAVTPSSIDFSNHDRASMVVFNTEDYVKDFSLDVYGSGFSLDKSALRIPPRSKAYVNLSSSCTDCEARLYVRELSTNAGIRIEPAIVVKLSSGTPPEADDELDSYSPQNEVTSFSFIDFSKPEIIVFLILASLLVAVSIFFLGRKFYIKRFHRKKKSRKKKWLKTFYSFWQLFLV